MTAGFLQELSGDFPGFLLSSHPHSTHHSILRIGLLIMHLSDLLLCGAVDLTQHTEPLTVTMETSSSLFRHEGYGGSFLQ